MRLWPGLLCFTCALAAADQNTGGANAEARAEANTRPVAAPPIPQRAADAADIQDEAILSRTLFGDLAVEDLTEEQAEEMLAAARRRFDRRQAEVDRAKKLIEEGVLARLALTPLLQDLDDSRRTLSLAESRAALFRELAEMARKEAEEPDEAIEIPRLGDAPPLAERFDGGGILRSKDFKRIADAFRKQFSRALPISARGATSLHRALGYDHRGRYDVALDPDQPEGVWLRALLQTWKIPYFAFRGFVPGRATGPHIHIGPPSLRIVRGG